jgi:type IV pilus assembly protein PilV
MRRQSGITLIEVLIAVLVLAIGLLGIAGLQTSAMTTNYTSYQYTQASILAQSMLERIRANRAAYANGNSYYNLSAGTAPTAGTDCSSGTCSAQDQANWDMGVWYAQITGNAVTNVKSLTASSSGGAVGILPSGAGSIVCDNPLPTTAPGKCLITVYWDPGRSATNNDYSCSGSTALHCFRLSAVLP